MAKITALSDVPFIIHDLRRTFITAAERLDISAYAIKRLVNHKMANDVTAGYIVSDVERLRKPAQRVCDFFLRAFDGEGIQHIALSCDDLPSCWDKLARRGLCFMTPPPDTYYQALEERLPAARLRGLR